ncbi:hypothetical protein X943_002952 [Babesia divergens]|uniref:Uncharacterized protein n=1 Tax=Babesia divergens TaxID=32595 RepID=A0AAD9GAP9_BABDI|nr:hypothetical protein X943_002952 [Babesia divergens]
MGSNLHKLRFMQTSNQPDVTPVHVVEKLLDEDSAWIAEGFEEVHKAHDNVATASQKNLTIRYSSRRVSKK